MSKTDWMCFVAAVLGVILFLLGANYYNAVVGWLGVILFLLGVLGLILLYVYHSFLKANAPSTGEG